MGNNLKASAEKLENLLRRQEEWRIKYSSALVSSQEVEVKEANGYLKNLISQAKSQETPSSIKLLAYKFDRIIKAGPAGLFLQSIQADLRKIAEKKYLALTSDLTKSSFFSQDVLDSYAALWQIKRKKRTLQGQDPSRFSSMKIIDKIDHHHMSKLSLSDLNEKLRETFESSLFYYPNSQESLTLKLSGQTDYKQTSYLKTETAYYKEPYTDYVLKRAENPSYLDKGFKRIEWRFHKDGFAHCYVNGRNVKKAECSSLPRPQKGVSPTTYYFAPVTRYREKSFDYQVLVHNEDYSVKIKGDLKNFGQKTSFDFFKTDHNQTESHNVSSSKAGVSPKYARFLDMKEEGNQASYSFAEKFKDKLNSEWSKRYCQGQGLSSSEEIEFSHRCALVDSEHPKVKRWYKSHFGITYGDFQKLTN